MNRKFFFLLIVLVAGLFAGAFAAEAPFEGVLEAYGEGGGMSNSATLYIHGDKARLSTQNKALATNGMPILDYEKMKISLLADKEKYYMEMALDQMENNLTAQPLVLKPTGKKETILGVAAEEFKGTDKETGVSIVAYGTKDIVSKVNVLVSFQKIMPDALAVSKTGRALLDMGYFPLKVNAVKGKDAIFNWQIKNIEKKKVDPSLFVILYNYMKFSDYMKKNTKKNRGR